MSDVNLDYPVEVSPERVWQAWTDSDEFERWYGPTGADIEVLEMDVVPGGTRHISLSMNTPGGPIEMWFIGQFTDVDEPNRLSYTESISNAAGEILTPAEAGLPADAYPTVTTVSMQLEPDGEGSRMLVQHAGVAADSPGATGWQMALNALVRHLESD